METFGQRIKRLREAAGLKQHELAARCGMGQSAIGNIENGKRGGSRNLAKLATALGVNPYYLETGEGPERTWSKNAMEIAALIDAMPEDRQELAMRMLRAALGPAVPDHEVERKMPVTKPLRSK